MNKTTSKNTAPVLTLKFRPPIRGFDKVRFNTFRCGEAYFKKLKVGDCVALVNTKTQEQFGNAYVSELYCGDKLEMAEQHGHLNHNIQSLEIVDNIASTLLKRLKNASGSRAYNNSDKVTVIYLEMVDE